MASSAGIQYEAILQLIGPFGRWQKRLIVLLWIPALYCGIAFMIYSFVLGIPEHYRCLVEECETLDEATYNASYINGIIPYEQDAETPSKCYRLNAPNCSANPHSGHVVLKAGENARECTSWVFDDSVYEATVITDFGLVCDRRYMKSAVGMLMVVIYGFGATLTGYISDTYGRKILILLCLLMGATMNLIASFSTNYVMYFGLYILAGLCINGTYLAPYVLSVELVGADYAALCSLLINFSFVLGELILVTVAFFFRDFRTMTRVAFVPTYLFLTIWFFIPESPRWLIVNNRIEEAKDIIREGAKANGNSISEEILNELTKPRKEEVTPEHANEQNITDEQVHIWYLLRNPNMRKRLLIMYVNWIAVVLCYNGLILNSVNLGGNIYLNMALGVIIEIPSYIFCIITVDRYGRRPILLLTHFLTFAPCIVGLLLPEEDFGPWPVVAMATVAKFGTTAAFSVILLQVLELFPTSVRNTAMGSCSLMSRIGGILAPLITNLGPGYESLPMQAFILVSFLGFLTGFFLPETAGKELPANIWQAEQNDDSPTIRGCLTYYLSRRRQTSSGSSDGKES